MATSRNGWTNLNSFPASRPGPVNRRPKEFANSDVADVLAYAMWMWHTRIETILAWGGGRTIGFNASINGHPESNHVSGTATDGNWPPYGDHPYERRVGSAYRSGFTSAEIAVLREIQRECRDDSGRTVLRLGIDFDAGWRDAMHIEIAPGVKDWQVAQAARRIARTFQPPRTFAEIGDYQRLLNIKPDELHGPGTVATIRGKQTAWGLDRTGLFDVALASAYAKRERAAKAVSDQLETLGYPATIAGVEDYQRDNRLSVDGLAGGATRSHMEARMARIESQLDTIIDQNKALMRAVRAVPARTIRQRMVDYKEEFGGVAPRVQQLLFGMTTRSVEDVQLSRETAEALSNDSTSVDARAV